MTSDKSRWKVFRKREVAPIPAYPATTLKPRKGCPCGNDGPCKQRVTPRGVTIHYPQKKKKFGKFAPSRGYLPSKSEKGYHNNPRPNTKVKVIRQRKFPTWRLDKIYCR